MAQIIQKKIIPVEQNWQKELASGFTSPKALLSYLHLDDKLYGNNENAKRLFPMRIPRHFASLIEKGNWSDPILKQVLPMNEEFNSSPQFSIDPLNEHKTVARGILHKYKSRALLMVRGGCAINCRYCFRRHFPYNENAMNKQQWEENLKYIHDHPEINEIILSGGDPLMANDAHLSWLTDKLKAIPNLKRLRIHTRLPVVLPNRIDNSFSNWIASLPFQRIIVLHINHANEVSPLLKEKINSLSGKGITWLNQAVLLKGINDDVTTQVALSEAVFDAGILPYYLHTLDKVQGASHFDVSLSSSRNLMGELVKRLPGFLVPKLVSEIGGQPGKTPIDLRLHPND